MRVLQTELWGVVVVACGVLAAEQSWRWPSGPRPLPHGIFPLPPHGSIPPPPHGISGPPPPPVRPPGPITNPPPPPAVPRDYVVAHHYDAESILDEFKFMTAADFMELVNRTDPSHGFVNYVDRATAEAQGLAKVMPGRPGRKQLFLGVDNSTVLSTNSTGRNSIRLESKKAWTSGLLIADFSHMPGNQCGVWPAFWNYNMKEDPISEIDIIEGLGWQKDNMVSLHTGNNCSFQPGWETGKDFRAQCGLYANVTHDGPTGCGVTASTEATYGDAFNLAGGGVYATLVDENSIKVWHWPRAAVPRDVHCGRPKPERWGTPVVDLSRFGGGCDIAQNFHTMTIILNTNFCGANVPQTFWEVDTPCIAQSPTCESFVAGNPGAFHDTYWLVNYIRVYERRDKLSR